MTIVVKRLIQVVFFVSSALFPVNNNKVTFASYRSSELRGNLLNIYHEFYNRGQNYKFTFLFKRLNSTFLGKISYFFHIIRSSYHLATSRFFFIDDFYFPIYVITPRKGTEIIQLWHAAGAFKKFGYSTLSNTFGPSQQYLKHVKVHSNYSKVIVSSSEVIPYYAEAFNMSESNIIPLGVPRTDIFFEKEKCKGIISKFYIDFPELADKKVILYAPTFRGKSHYQEAYKCPIDFIKLKQLLGNEYVILLHLHPFMNSVSFLGDYMEDFIYQIQDDYNIHELMIISDMLITDYSSVVFDYSLLGRPVAFFADDLEQFKLERDFYYDYDTFIPGPSFKETDKLAQWILKAEFDIDAIINFRNRFFNFVDGQSSKRIVDFLLDEV